MRRLDAPVRFALTGTPMENRLIELWSLLSVVAPGLYPSPTRFTETVATAVEKEGDAQALARFRRRIRPFLLRRTKDLVAAELPAKQEQVLEVPLGGRHRRIYQTRLQRERQHVLGLLEDFDRQRMAIFRSLTTLRQLALDPALVDPEHDRVGSAKLEVLVDHLHELAAEGHRALVFSQFTGYLARVRARLEREGLATVYLDGRSRNRTHSSSSGARRRPRLPDQPQGRRRRAHPHRSRLRLRPRPLVEPRRRGPGRRPRPPDRPDPAGHGLPARGLRHDQEKVMELKARKAALFGQVLDGAELAGGGIDADDVRAILDD